MSVIKPADTFPSISFNLVSGGTKTLSDDIGKWVIATSNSPSVRPDLEVVLDGIIGTQDRGLPIRGTHS